MPGVDPVRWALPQGTALRYELPDARLRPFFPSYAVLGADPAVWQGSGDWVLPGWAQLWINMVHAPVEASMRLGNVPLATVVVFGGTSQVMPITSSGGVTVVVDISPAGWARFFDMPAEAVRDQVLPIAALGHADWSDELIALLQASDRGDDVKGLLDAFFLARMPPPHRDENTIYRLTAALAYDMTGDGRVLAGLLDRTPRALVRPAMRYFGYGPKVLLRRTRFLRALVPMLMADDAPDFAITPPGYHDIPHFLRDAKLFLGMTPRRFLAQRTPYLRAVLRGRTDVLGAPLPLLDPF